MAKLRIAVQGCCHGELEQIFEKVREIHSKAPIDLLIILGDFQSIRNDEDFQSISIPPKYRRYGDFKDFYLDDSRRPPVRTIFIGGNHESMRHLMLLPHGGYVANDIYYMGYSNLIWYRGIKIGALSGIWKKWDFKRERPSWESLEQTSSWNERVRELYHVRETDMLPLFMLNDSSAHPDIMISHDWPNGVVYHGDMQDLLRKKPFFSKDIQMRQLGNPRSWDLLRQLKPKWWLSAHLHVKFEATVKHSKRPKKKNNDELELQLSSDEEEDNAIEPVTRFLALDKCQPKRKWLEIIEVDADENHESWKHQDSFFYDPQFIANLQTLHKTPPVTLHSLANDAAQKESDWLHYEVPKYTEGVQRSEQEQTSRFTREFLSF